MAAQPIPDEWKKFTAEELIAKAKEISDGKRDDESIAISNFLRWALQRLDERRQRRDPDATI